MQLSIDAPNYPAREVETDEDGRFTFSDVPPGSFTVSISVNGFATNNVPGTLHAGEQTELPSIALTLATKATEVEVSVTPREIAEEQIKEQEQQRVLGIIPNFAVSYIPDALPLNPRQKYELAWRTVIDPFSFLAAAATAGIQQTDDDFDGYGQGAAGYARRYGAIYGDFLIGSMLGGAVLPSILKQDPRYFYKGTGTVRSRILYAIANSVICKGDNQRWQFNASAILGGMAAAGISNLYYSPKDRNGAALTFENTAIGIASQAGSNLLQEFVLRRVTPKVPGKKSASGTAEKTP